MNKRLAVGKYKGRLASDVERMDFKYYQWYLKSVNKFI